MVTDVIEERAEKIAGQLPEHRLTVDQLVGIGRLADANPRSEPLFLFAALAQIVIRDFGADFTAVVPLPDGVTCDAGPVAIIRSADQARAFLDNFVLNARACASITPGFWRDFCDRLLIPYSARVS